MELSSVVKSDELENSKSGSPDPSIVSLRPTPPGGGAPLKPAPPEGGAPPKLDRPGGGAPSKLPNLCSI